MRAARRTAVPTWRDSCSRNVATPWHVRIVMKRSLMVVLAALAACDECGKSEAPDAGPVDAGPLVMQEKEPNNGPETALVLSGSSIVEANLGADPARPDEDWYVLKSSIPKTADLTVTPPPGADVALEVMDEARTVLSSINAAGEGKPERLVDLDVSGKAY